MPVTEKGNQPQSAIYTKRCVKPIEEQLKTGDPKIVTFFSQVRVKKIPEAELRAVDSHLVSFFNINTPEDLAASEGLQGEESV